MRTSLLQAQAFDTKISTALAQASATSSQQGSGTATAATTAYATAVATATARVRGLHGLSLEATTFLAECALPEYYLAGDPKTHCHLSIPEKW